jgi:hypothetical protein
MAEPKTRPTGASVQAYLAARGSDEQRSDCRALMKILARVTAAKPKMWGPSIVGYGAYTYTYDSGRTGGWPLAGFAIRGRELVVYLMADDAGQQALLARLGPHRMTKSCLYLKRLRDLDVGVLERLVASSVAEVKRRHPGESPARLMRFPGAVERDPAIEEWLRSRRDDLSVLARRWFGVMRRCGADVRELLHDDQPTACVGDAAFGYVDAFTAHVNVGFFRGAALPDPRGLLAGTGRFMRHVKLRPGIEVDEAALTRLITAAYADMRRCLGAA